MGLVSATEMLNKAKEGHYAVGQFNINNLEWTKSILLTAEELKAPVILGVSEGAAKYMTGFKTVSSMVLYHKPAQSAKGSLKYSQSFEIERLGFSQSVQLTVG